jgi:hypothetical protein
MQCDEFKSRIVEALYYELKNKDLEDFSKHLDSCDACEKLYRGMKATIKIMKQRKNSEIDPSFSTELWERIEPSLSPKIKPKIHHIFTWRPSAIPSWAYGLAAIFLIAVGIFVGRYYFSPSDLSSTMISPGLQSESVGNDTTTAHALAYLKRSKNFLLGVVNAPADHEIELDTERSRQLVYQANVIYAALNRPDQQQLRRLINDLRIILLQLSNVEVKPGVPAIELAQNSIDRKSIFLKINIEELRAMADQPLEQKKNTDKNIL